MKETLHIYTRVSSDTQEDNTSLDNQLRMGITIANKLGMDYQHWNEGVGSSKSEELFDRPIISELYESMERGLIKHFYVEYQDRISRHYNSWNTFRFLMDRSKVLLYSGTDTTPKDISDERDNLLVGILGEIAMFDNKTRTRRMTQGKFNRVAEGRWHGGSSPFGYELVDGFLQICPIQSPWVKKIYQWYLDRESIDSIRENLLINGVLTNRGKPQFDHNSIYSILKNTHYNGYYTVTNKRDGQTYTVQCPPLVDSTTYEQVRDLMESRSHGQRVRDPNTKHIYMLKKIMKCSCGLDMTGFKKKDGRFEYRCPAKQRNYHQPEDKQYICHNRNGLAGELTENQVWDTVIQQLDRSHLFKDMMKLDVLGSQSLKQSTLDLTKIQNKVKKIDSDIDKVSKAIGRVQADMMIDEDNEVEFKSMLDRLHTQKRQLQDQRDRLNTEVVDQSSQSKWVDWVNEFGKRITQLKKIDDPKVRREFLDGVVEKIDVGLNDEGTKYSKLSIHFILPFVDDDLIWRDPKKKSKGYDIKNGSKTTETVVDKKKELI